MPELPLFTAEAERGLRVFKRLRVPDVRGKPPLGQLAGPWFFDIVEAIFGAYDAANDLRMIQEAFLLVPKKNSKTTNAAGLVLALAICCRRPTAEHQIIAPTKLIADLAFGQAQGMIRADPALTKLFHIQRHIRTITHRVSECTIQVKAADTDTVTGGKSAVTLVDETHEFAKKSRAADVFIEARGALAARPDGLLIQITTQSKVPPAGVFRAELARARAVRDGRLKLPLLAVTYELPPALAKDGGWKNPSYFPLVNPNLGRSVDAGFLEREWHAAEEEGAEKLALFASQHMNVEIGLALLSNRWAGADYWEAQAETGLTLDAVLERSEVLTMGIDGGGLDDLLGAAVLGRERVTKRWLLWTHAWADVGVLERRKSEAQRLRDFAEAGELSLVDGLGDDIRELAKLCERVDKTGKLAEIGLDPAGIGAVVDALAEKHIDGDRVVGVTQGWKMTGAIKTTERKLAEGSLVHCGGLLMPWCVGNARVEPKGNAIVITKQASGTGKIDTLMAAFDAVALMSLNPEPPGLPYSALRGLLVIG